MLCEESPGLSVLPEQTEVQVTLLSSTSTDCDAQNSTMNQDILEWIISCPFTFFYDTYCSYFSKNNSFFGKKAGKPVILATGDEVEFKVVSV